MEHQGVVAGGRAVRRARFAVLVLAVSGALLAQGTGDARPAQSSRLSVRPKEMAKATANPKAAEYPLETVKEVLVSVPPQGQGKKRCPLVVMLPGGGIPARQMMDWLRPTADKHGMILLTTTKYETSTIDAALKETLMRFAIDPDKIAIIGRCASGGAATRFGVENLDVFSRVISISGGHPLNGLDKENKTVEFLIDKGFLESQGGFGAVRQLRADGHPAKQALALRGHEHQMEDYDFVGHWLQETWAKPKAEDRTPPSVVADPLPELTSEALKKMTNFWTLFGTVPPQVRATLRRQFLREVVVPVGTEKPIVWMTDMAAYAAKAPMVAGALKKAGLTAQQHDAFRVALISALVAKSVGNDAGTIEQDSVQAKNLAFLEAHSAEFEALRAAGIEKPDQVKQVEASATITHPKLAEAMGAMGIWRTP